MIVRYISEKTKMEPENHVPPYRKETSIYQPLLPIVFVGSMLLSRLYIWKYV